MANFHEAMAAVQTAAKEFPHKFKLRAFEGTFYINHCASYMNDSGVIMLYVYNINGDAFSKCTAEELRGQIVEAA